MVDIGETYEDRRFPHAANVPCIYINGNEPADKNLSDIIIAAIVETIRFNYARICLKKYQDIGLFGGREIHICSRPPEFTDLPYILKKVPKATVVYPDPPIFEEEKVFFDKLEIDTCTPLSSAEGGDLTGRRIGISISEIDEDSLIKLGQKKEHLTSLSANLAKNILSHNACMVYGGDFRNGSFAYPMLEEAIMIKERLGIDDNIIAEYVSWPFYEEEGFDEKIERWTGGSNIMELIRCKRPDELRDVHFNLDRSGKDREAWSISLTSMRSEMIRNCDYRICAGGKCSGYLGKMPGILEEILIALKLNKPLFLIGGFGGITADICNVIRQKDSADTLSDEFHEKICKNGFLEAKGIEYKSIVDGLKKINIGSAYAEYHVGLNNGLTEEENIKLFTTPFIDEAIYLVLRGLSRISAS